ncbi:class I SAM-dependent methyltransferase [Microbacterium sp. 22195]|uniref:class I SAM-dependent methyltransferase n=1 Tax=Microbacterium sp. 22195 TaxID=3453891 RepID=UPI003F858C0B
MDVRLLEALGRFNAAHPWSHNDAYSGFVLRHARAVRRAGGDTAVDVGCGTGNLLRRLARVFPVVIGIEPDAPSAAIAEARAASPQVRIDVRAFGTEPRNAYDLVVFVASLHHMSLDAALTTVRDSLRPGGRLVVVGIAKETPSDALRSAVSMALNPIIGLLRHPRRAVRHPEHMTSPVAEASQTFEDIRAAASAVLPGIRMRRRLFWRYTAFWIAPQG